MHHCHTEIPYFYRVGNQGGLVKSIITCMPPSIAYSTQNDNFSIWQIGYIQFHDVLKLALADSEKLHLKFSNHNNFSFCLYIKQAST